MAIKGGEIKYSVSFDINTQNVTKAFDKIRNLTTSDLKKISPQIDDKQLNAELQKIRGTVNTLESAFTKAFNPKLNTVNIKTFKNELANSNTNLQQVYNTLKQTGEIGDNAFRQLSTKMLDTNIKLKETSGLFKEIGVTLKNSIKWNIASSVVNTFSGKVQEAYGYVKNLDSSLNDIRIVTGKSADEMDRFAEKANKAAQNLGKSTTDYTKASLIYYQQGLSDEETAARTDVTLKAANVTQQSTQEVSEQLTAVWNGYKVSAQEAELYVDKLAAVAAGTASDLEELSTGMSKVASAANALGVDVDQMNAILSTSISVTRQAPETIGSAYKTIFARMSTISAGGTDEEDGATLTSYTEKMSKLGVNVLDANNQLRDMGDVIEEVGGKWNTFSKEQQIALAQVMAGTRQYNNLIALFDNWDKYTDALNMSANAAGTLNEQQEIYMESAQAKLQSLATATEGIFDSLLSGEDIGKVADTILPIVQNIESLIDAIGGGTGVLQLFGPMLLRSFSPEIAQQILTIHHNLQAVASNKQALQNLHETINMFTHIEGVEGATEELMEYERQLNEFANFMSPTEFEEQKKKIVELSNAYEEYGATRAAVDKKLSQLSKTLGLDEKDITRDNYESVADKQSKELISNLQKQQEELSTLAQGLVLKHDGNGNEYEVKGTDAAKEKLEALQEIIKNLSNSPGFDNLQQQFDELKNSMEMEDAAEKFEDFVSSLDEAIVNELGALNDPLTELTGEIGELTKAEDIALQNTEELSQSVSQGFSDERLRDFTEGTVELASSLFQVGSAAVNLATNLHNIWNNDDLTNAEKFAQTLQLIAMNAGVMGNGLSAAKKAIDKLGSTYRASVKDQAANTIGSNMQAKANQKVAKTAKEAGEAVKKAAKEDVKEAGTSELSAAANNKQADALKQTSNPDQSPSFGTNVKDTLKGGIEATKTGLTKLGKVMTGTASIGAGITSFAALAAAITAVVVAIKLSYDAFTETERAVEKAQEAYDNSKKSLQEVTSEVNNLNSAIDQIDQERATLNELITGTTEWKEQLDKVNESVANLLEQFPELKQYATFKDGGWEIENSKLEEFQQQLKERQADAQNMVYANEIDLAAAKRDKAAHKAQNDATDFGSTVGATAAGSAMGGAFVGTIAGALLGGPIGAAIGAGIGATIAGAGGAVEGVLQGKQDKIEAAENIDYDKSRTSSQETKALLEKFQNTTDETLKASLKQEITNTFTGLNENSSNQQIEEYLANLVSLQEAQNELDKIQTENSKAMLDANFGDQISKALTDKGYNERQQQVIKNAVERRAAQDSITRGQTIRTTLLNDNQAINEKDPLAEEFREYIKKVWAQQMNINVSDVEYKIGQDGKSFHLQSKTDSSIESNKIDYQDYLEDFIAYQTTSDEKAAQRIDSWINSFESSNNGAYMTALADEVVAGNVDISELTQSELDTLTQMAKEGIGGINSDTLASILEEGQKNEDAIRNSITSDSGTRAYDLAISLQGAESLTQQQKQALADKINEIYSESGKNGVDEFIRQIEGTNIQVALSFDPQDAKTGISKAAQDILDEAKIDAEAFKMFRENAQGDFSDVELANTLAAQEKLNKIYKDREDIFKSLEGAELGSLSGEQQDNVLQIQDALQQLTGLDFSFEEILDPKNLDAISGYFDKTEEGMKKFNAFISEMKQKKLDVNAVFESYSDLKIGLYDEGLEKQINDIASQLDLTDSQIRQLYASKGYLYNTNTGHYEKVENVELAFKIQSADQKYNIGDEVLGTDIQTLMEEYGVKQESELAKYGWKLVREDGMFKWIKVSNFIDISNYSEITIDKTDPDNVAEFISSADAKSAIALEAQGYIYYASGPMGAGYYKWKDIYEILQSHQEYEAVPSDQVLGEEDDGKKNKNSLSGSEKKYKKKYEIVYDFYDQTISAKERELKALQDAEKNLTGEALTNNLKKQKELYEEIVKQQEEKLKLAKEDIDLQKKKVEDLASEYNLNVQYDDNGYISNIGDILKQLDNDAASAGKEYDAEYKKLKANQDSNQSLTEDETKHLSDLSDAYDKATDKLNDFKEAYDQYISALDKKNDVIDNIIETQNNIDDTRISSYLAATNKEFERLSTEASNFASAMSDAVAQFQKLSGDEQIDSLKKWQDIASVLKEVYSLQKDTLKNDLGNIVSMGDADDSGLKGNDEWKSIAEDIKAIQSSDKDLLDMTKYLEILARIENQITLAQKNLDDLRARGASEDDIKNATARLNSYKAIKTEMEEGAKAAQALAKNMDDIYLTAGEVKDQFVDWQVSAIDTQIGLIDKKISRLQKQAGKLKGQALIDNLKQQNQQIEKQIKLEKGKLKILQAQMKIKRLLLQQSLSELAASLGTQLSLSFDNLGNITAESIEQMQRVVTASLKGAGAMGAAAQQQWNALLQSMESYNAAAAAVQASMDAIEGYGDSMQDNVDSMKEALKEARNLALEIFNAKVDVEINIEDAWRQFDKLKATMNGIKENNFLAQAELSAKNIQRYLGDISNPNSYFGSGKGSIGILTDHLNDIMSEISVIQSGGESQYYGKDEGAAFDDLTNYANQLMSQVEAYYQELENVRQQYSNAIDAIISKNQELIEDYDKMNQLNKHGINLTKLLYGEESYDKLSQYYNNISNNTKEMLKQAADSKQYYAAQMARLQAQGDTDSEAYQKMREGYEESMQQVYEYGEQLLEQYSEELMNKVNSYQQKMTDTLANLAGFADKTLMDQDWEHQTKLMDDYLDATNAAYEMQALQSKFQSSIDDTDSLSAKKELTKVMNEQLGILEKQLEDGQMLTQYDIDRANKVYELTLKQIALEEAQQNKSKMRLRRDSQGNYRYEYVADQQKVEDARQELLKAQNDLYNLDKKRTVEMINEIQTLQTSYYEKQKAILQDSYLSEEEKKQALVDLEMKYYGQPDGLIYMAVQEYAQARNNMEESTDKQAISYHNTMAEAMIQNWNDITAIENENTQKILADISAQQAKVEEATSLMSQGYGSLDEAIQTDIASMEILLDLDESLLNQYQQEMLAIEDLMKELEDLEDHYKSVLEAAMAAVEAALQLRQMSWEEDDNKSSNSSNNNTSNNGSGSTTESSGGGGSISSRYAEIKVNNNNKGCISSNNGNLTKSEKSTIQSRAKNRGLNISTAMLSDKEAEKKYGKVTTLYIPFDTGGYTGQWGNEGKIAMLHEKELVLNKTDTQNILDAVSIVRNLTSGLSSLQNSLVGQLTSSTQNISNNIDKEKTILDQNVHIEATFPNVSNSNEIEKAFNDLVNLASQRAMSTRR